MDLRRTQLNMYIWLGGFLLCIQRFGRRLLYDKDLDIFLGYMQGALDTQGLSYIQV